MRIKFDAGENLEPHHTLIVDTTKHMMQEEKGEAAVSRNDMGKDMSMYCYNKVSSQLV